MLILTMAGRSLSLLARAAARTVRALNNRIEVRELAHLDERSLKDIGLTRSDVAGALAASWLQDPSHILAERAGAGRRAAANRGLNRPAANAAKPTAPVRSAPAIPLACNA